MKKLDENSFGWRLRKARQNKGLTQRELAKRVYCCTNVLMKWEENAHKPSYDFIVLLCKALDVSADWLLGIKREERDNDSEQFI